MDELDQLWVPEIKDYRLNERHYGDCIGEAQLAGPTHAQAQPYPKPAPCHVVVGSTRELPPCFAVRTEES